MLKNLSCLKIFNQYAKRKFHFVNERFKPLLTDLLPIRYCYGTPKKLPYICSSLSNWVIIPSLAVNLGRYASKQRKKRKI